MTIVERQVDQVLRVGRDVELTLTDVDPAGVRLLARGRVLGGPRDGERFESVHEIARGGSTPVATGVVVTLIEVRGPVARLGVYAPKHVEISLADGT